jgi:hypothetical protein
MGNAPGPKLKKWGFNLHPNFGLKNGQKPRNLKKIWIYRILGVQWAKAQNFKLYL